MKFRWPALPRKQESTAMKSTLSTLIKLIKQLAELIKQTRRLMIVVVIVLMWFNHTPAPDPPGYPTQHDQQSSI